MSFSASTCLSYTGTTTLTNPLLLYSDFDSYSSSFGSLSLSAITGGNCPYIINNIPDGTTKIKILSKNNYCVFIDISCNQICDVCDLNFSAFTNVNSIGKISVSNLTGSCQSNISDYLINWYGPDSITNLAFTSGKGTNYTYGYQHPITDLLTIGGTYRPRIQKIVLSGITFSPTGGTNQVLADLNCLPNVTVQDFNCSNGNSATTYSHTMNFVSKSNNVQPTALNAKFLLTGATNYFALSFTSYAIPDTVTVTFSGANYSNPIVLENMTVGTTGNGNNVTPTLIPKQVYTTYYSKVLCLTGLTITPIDFLIITVTPNQSVNDTSWDLSLKCLNTIDTTLNGYEVYKNQPFKISASTITYSSGSCNSAYYTAKMIGIPTSGTPKIFDYLGNTPYQTSTVNTSNTGTMYGTGNTSCSHNAVHIGDETCIATGNTVIFNRTYNSVTSAATYYMEFSNYFDFKDYYDSANYALTFIGSTNPTSPTYYKQTRLRHHRSNITQPTTTCSSDNVTYSDFMLHLSTMIVTTGMSASNYTLTIVQPKLPSASSIFGGCALYCQSTINQVINNINNSTTAATANNYISSVGLRTKKPFTHYWYLDGPTASASSTASTIFTPYVMYNSYGNLMYPYSGTNTLIPSLSAITSSSINSLPYYDNLRNIQRLGEYQIRLPNPSNRGDYEIWGRPISNYNYSGGYELAYRYSGGVVTYSSSTYII